MVQLTHLSENERDADTQCLLTSAYCNSYVETGDADSRSTLQTVVKYFLITTSNLSHLIYLDASSNEAVHLQQRLRSLSSELVTLRNRLHVTNVQPNVENGSLPLGYQGICNYFITTSFHYPCMVLLALG